MTSIAQTFGGTGAGSETAMAGALRRASSWYAAHKTRKALRNLTDDQLYDIGVNYGDIERVTASRIVL